MTYRRYRNDEDYAEYRYQVKKDQKMDEEHAEKEFKRTFINANTGDMEVE